MNDIMQNPWTTVCSCIIVWTVIAMAFIAYKSRNSHTTNEEDEQFYFRVSDIGSGGHDE